MRKILTLIIILLPICIKAQVGEHRNNLAVGINGGYVLSNVGFVPKVTQDMHGGITGGITARYVCEKYFSTICSVQAEVNWVQAGWQESILDEKNLPCINNVTGLPEEYKRTLTYIQVPLFAHLAWGKERKGAQFFFQVGPQFGYKIGEKTTTNFAYEDALNTTPHRTNSVIAQDSINIQHNFDYGIAGGLGMEISIPKAGHIQLEARYYYGLGNIYRDTKSDYFAKSNLGNIIVKLSYLFDIF